MVADGGGPPHLPEGWFAVAFSHDLRPGRVQTVTLAGRELVLWRTADGTAAATEPWCPHLGAHLGHGGTADGTTLRCPFHAFRFGLDGTCVATGYGTRPPGVSLSVVPVVERYGAILAWHHPTGEPPQWEVPPGPFDQTDPDDATDRGWSGLRTHRFDLAGHPQETSENSVDLGHLSVVHGYQRVDIRHEVTVEGPVLRAAYAMDRPLGLPGTDRVPGLRRLTTRVEFRATLHGLGVSVVEATMPAFGLRTHQLVLATPTEPGRIALRLGFRLNTTNERVGRSEARLAWRLLLDTGARLGLAGFVHDVRSDVPIWSHKRYLPQPAIAPGDGPIGRYRRWARQFY